MNMILTYQQGINFLLIKVDEKKKLKILNQSTNNQFVPLKEYLEIAGLLNNKKKQEEYAELEKKLSTMKEKQIVTYLNKEMATLGLTHKRNNVIKEKEL